MIGNHTQSQALLHNAWRQALVGKNISQNTVNKTHNAQKVQISA